MISSALRNIVGHGVRHAAVGVLMAALALAGTASVLHGAWAQDRPSACHLAAPDAWHGARIEWIGPCRSGHASGLGVAVARFDGRLHERFFGNVSAGNVVDGVFEVPGGYRPVRVKDRVEMPLDDRNQLIAVFRAASAAARAARDRYRAAGDMKAVRDYADAAERLASQID
jgi:hypothetical protein